MSENHGEDQDQTATVAQEEMRCKIMKSRPGSCLLLAETLTHRPPYARQCGWEWCQLSELIRCIDDAEKWLMEQGLPPSGYGSEPDLVMLCEMFGLIMGGVNSNERGWGMANYLIISPVENGLPMAACHFNVSLEGLREGVISEHVREYTNDEIMVPTGWAQAILKLMNEGVTGVDLIPPPWRRKNNPPDIYAHAVIADRDTGQILTRHMMMHRSDGWKWNTHLIRQPKEQGPLPQISA